MKHWSKHHSGVHARRRPVYCRPQLDVLESRLPPGDTVLAAMLGFSLLGSDVAGSDSGLGASQIDDPDTPAGNAHWAAAVARADPGGAATPPLWFDMVAQTRRQLPGNDAGPP